MQQLRMHATALNRAPAPQRLCRHQPFTSGAPAQRLAQRARSSTEEATTTEQQQQQQQPQQGEPGYDYNVDKEITRFTRNAAATFAPRASTAQKNPAVRGSTLFWIFEYQAWIAMAAGALLSYNVLFPTDGPAIPRLLG